MSTADRNLHLNTQIQNCSVNSSGLVMPTSALLFWNRDKEQKSGGKARMHLFQIFSVSITVQRKPYLSLACLQIRRGIYCFLSWHLQALADSTLFLLPFSSLGGERKLDPTLWARGGERGPRNILAKTRYNYVHNTDAIWLMPHIPKARILCLPQIHYCVDIL